MGIVFPDSTVQTTSAKQLGIDQTYITPSRAIGTTYTNTTAKPIWISVVASKPAGGFADLYLVVNNIMIQRHAHGSDSGVPYFMVSGVVPPGNTYTVSSDTMTLVSWIELS